MDGRQLLSDPCQYDEGKYTRYNQSELLKVGPSGALVWFSFADVGAQSFSVSQDRFHDVKRLDLSSFDGSPMSPMYLVDKTPKMLPTTTLSSTPSAAPKNKRHYVEKTGPSIDIKGLMSTDYLLNPDRWWWLGILMTSIGGITLFYS